MERNRRLLGTVFAAGFCLGLLTASGCFGTYLIWKFREPPETMKRFDSWNVTPVPTAPTPGR